MLLKLRLVISQWIQRQSEKSIQVTISDIFNFAKSNTPTIFRFLKTYNAQYVLCRRVLQENIPMIHKIELEIASQSLLDLQCVFFIDEKKEEVSNLYKHINQVDYGHAKPDKTLHIDTEAFCTCKGKKNPILICH